MKKSLIVFFFLLFSCTAFAGIATKEKHDILKLIGTSFAFNGKFAWIELNGEDYGWRFSTCTEYVIKEGVYWEQIIGSIDSIRNCTAV